MMGMLTFFHCIFVFSSLLILFALISTSTAYCDGRKILTNVSGTISDGLQDYKNYTRCEWLIDAGSSEKFIQLEFDSMETECSYDFVMVFDGDSFNSTVLATFSGNTLPRPVIAVSGYMLVYMFSDRNYNLKGFQARYKIEDCPYMCFGHGQCHNHTCICDSDYTGDACEHEICPRTCVYRGQCNQNGCSCDPGFYGDDCSLPDHRTADDVRWYNLSLSSQNFTARFGHSGAFIKSVNCIYVFGGFSLYKTLNDVVRYCLSSNRWEIAIQSKPWPEARKNHASFSTDDGFYIMGGVFGNGTLSNDLWFYNITSETWTEITLNSTVLIPPLMDFTLTYANGWLYVIGGKTSEGLFSSDIYRINATDFETWVKLNISGDRQQTQMVSGHTAVFHEVTNSIIVYGGYRSSYSKYVELSSDIYSLNLQHHIWSHVHYNQMLPMPYNQDQLNVNSVPTKRAHHTSVIMGNYMIVYGGNIHIHKNLETCYDNQIFLYHLGCHKWTNHPLFTEVETKGRRRYGHVAVTGFGNIMFVVGGYSGTALGDVMAFKFPSTISPSETEVDKDKDFCMAYTDPGGAGTQSCIHDLECVLCDSRKDTTRVGCVHRSRKEMCDPSKEYITSECPGICSSLRSCEACLGQGQGLTLTLEKEKKVYTEECSWCVKSAKCQRSWELEGVCFSGTETKSELQGWWNGTSPSWTALEQCTTNDYRAGLQLIYYYTPQDILQPDFVEYLETTHINIETKLPFHGNIETIGKMITARVTGYIHPLNAKLVYGTSSLQLHMRESSVPRVTINLSNDSSVKNQEIVLHQTSQKNVPSSAQAHRQNGSPLFPHRERGYKYYLSIEAQRDIEEGKAEINLEWNIDLGTSYKDSLHTISMEFLEPYNSHHCSIHSNCLVCMTDGSCAWCPATSTCLYKGDNSTRCEGTYAVTQPDQCNMCHDHPDCYSCVNNHLCEWSTKHEKCIRRGRDVHHARQISECPTPCYQRKNCSSCVEKDQDECFWCENTQECFPFAHYISQHMTGQCQEWVDSDDLKHNHTCRDCSIYKSCDQCLSRHGCGWCGNVENRLIGRCVDGDFSGPSTYQNCSIIVAEEGKDQNITMDDPAAWMYDKCLDVDECSLGIYECDENAYCENTDVSYICRCNRGYLQVGSVCQKTCYHECVHGHCGPDHECQCDIGYTGPDCNIDCLCNNQSTCTKGVGICDKCLHHTGGTYCQLCLPGYHGKPSEGCSACSCNGHGDLTRGTCDSTTGECFCSHNTEGKHCQNCQQGYYGDPRNEGKCYRNCDNRVVLDQMSGSFGSYQGSGVRYPYLTYISRHQLMEEGHLFLTTEKSDITTSCMWIIYDRKIEDVDSDSRLQVPMDISVTITIDDIITECGKEHVYIYEGIPSSIYGKEATTINKGLVASFCGTEKPSNVTVNSRLVTVVFETNGLKHGFNATYQVNDCDKNCMYQQNRVCLGNQCVCDVGYAGDNCQNSVCEDGCVFDKEFQSCHCNPTIGPVEILPWYNSIQPDIHLPEEVSRARYGHTLVACGSDLLYMFGGYSLKHGFLNDLWKYNVTERKWTQIIPITNTEPSGRYYHTAVYLDYLKTIYVFGGLVKDLLGNTQTTNEMWKFAIGAHKWTVEVSDDVDPVAGHTMTKVQDATLVIIGGISKENYFSENLYEYDATNSRWRQYNHYNLVGAPTGLYGHSAVYHDHLPTVYIYGGIQLVDKLTTSNRLYAFDLVTKQWNNLQSFDLKQTDGRVFHSAVVLGSYMVIVGGQSYNSFPQDILIYNFLCNHWIKVKLDDEKSRLNMRMMSSAAAVAIGTNFYIMGGFDGTVHSRVLRFKFPVELCEFLHDETECINTPGCKGCIMEGEDGTNLTHCFSATIYEFLPSRCYPSNKILYGKGVCSSAWYKRRQCGQYKSCDTCLAVHPHFKDEGYKVCQWCDDCEQPRCINTESEDCFQSQCKPATFCHNPCGVSTCQKCKNISRQHHMNICHWLSKQAVFDNSNTWSCQLREYKAYTPDTCEAPCFMKKNCQECLAATSPEGGGPAFCMWSRTRQECMSIGYHPLLCSHGNCGLLMQSNLDNVCHSPCQEFKQCSTCLKGQGCGWCAGNNGKGLCMEGGINQPTNDTCGPLDGSSYRQSNHKYHLLGTTQPVWTYLSCPPENECMNGHHTCNSENQNCIDTLEGFECQCKEGYREHPQTKKCIAICHQGCQHGFCVRPDECDCYFGYVGNNCTVECECHNNSECESVDKRRHCLDCQNNSQGPQCEHCKIWHVGNPRQSKPCESCFTKCHNHTIRCSTVKDFTKLNAYTIHSTWDYDKVIPDFNPNGPTDNPICIRCQNNTEGRLCDVCQDGYFRLNHDGNSPKFDACIQCECHGHSNKCDNSTGECKQCYNNTKTTCSESAEICWRQQCTVCDEYFLGWPRHHHQCFRQVTVEREYCLDPYTQNECNQNPQPLLPGRTVFFCVQPRYLNVDIRITIDVYKGGSDIYFSTSGQTFTVKVNKDNGVHVLELDEALHFMNHYDRRWSFSRNKRSISLNDIHVRNTIMPDFSRKPTGPKELKNLTDGDIHELTEIVAENFHTYHTVTKTNTILVVKNVQSRLVITIPVHSHNLRTAKFFIVMYGVGGKLSNSTYGNLYFRQDQPHIDLFVFFSVFFSSFFLFLAICVLLWKMKQAVDTQRSRQQRAKEMMHMASRPFSKCLVYIEPEPILMSSTPILRRQKLPKIPNRNNVPIMGLPPVEILPPIVHTTMTIKEIVPFDVIPIAIEPVSSCSAAIRTVVIQLPGGSHATSKLCLGSTLTLNGRQGNNGQKGTARRRPSTTAC